MTTGSQKSVQSTLSTHRSSLRRTFRFLRMFSYVLFDALLEFLAFQSQSSKSCRRRSCPVIFCVVRLLIRIYSPPHFFLVHVVVLHIPYDPHESVSKLKAMKSPSMQHNKVLTYVSHDRTHRLSAPHHTMPKYSIELHRFFFNLSNLCLFAHHVKSLTLTFSP